MKQVIFSGIQPSGEIHLGNYLGALKQWVDLQDQYHNYFCIVDWHAITVPQDPKVLQAKASEIARLYLGAGIDPNKSTIFVQSEVKEHTELAWILSTITKLPELERMTQFKDKAAQQRTNASAGLLTYPILMAADILLYQTNLVPVGEDQKQHVELTRTLAERFNRMFGQVFTVPEVYVAKVGARVMGLDDPTKKMSKSASSANNYIALLDKPEAAKKKIMKAVTDSGSEVKGGAGKPALNNLLAIYSLLSGETVERIESRFTGQGYAAFKTELADVVAAFLSEFQKRANAFSDGEVAEILRTGAENARVVAAKTMTQVRERVGLR